MTPTPATSAAAPATPGSVPATPAASQARTSPTPPARKVAPAVAMTLAIVLAIAALAAAPFKMIGSWNDGSDSLKARTLEALLAPDAFFGVLDNDTIRPETLEILEQTTDGGFAFAVVTNDDVLLIGITAGDGPGTRMTNNSNPGEDSARISGAFGSDHYEYDLTVTRDAENHYTHTLTSHPNADFVPELVTP